MHSGYIEQPPKNDDITAGKNVKIIEKHFSTNKTNNHMLGYPNEDLKLLWDGLRLGGHFEAKSENFLNF